MWRRLSGLLLPANWLPLIVVLGRYRGTIKAGGATLDAQYCHWYRFRDGKVVTFQQYTDTAQWARLMK